MNNNSLNETVLRVKRSPAVHFDDSICPRTNNDKLYGLEFTEFKDFCYNRSSMKNPYSEERYINTMKKLKKPVKELTPIQKLAMYEANIIILQPRLRERKLERSPAGIINLRPECPRTVNDELYGSEFTEFKDECYQKSTIYGLYTEDKHYKQLQRLNQPVQQLTTIQQLAMYEAHFYVLMENEPPEYRFVSRHL